MNRDMYYQNLTQGYQNPGMFIPPSGYNINTNYQSYGNIAPVVQPNQGYYQNNNSNNYSNDLDERLDKIERQIKNLDTRVQKLEMPANQDNVYMV